MAKVPEKRWAKSSYTIAKHTATYDVMPLPPHFEKMRPKFGLLQI